MLKNLEPEMETWKMSWDLFGVSFLALGEGALVSQSEFAI